MYFAGDGSTTFNLPNFDEYTVWQGDDSSQVGQSYEGHIPNAIGSFAVAKTSYSAGDGSYWDGVFYRSGFAATGNNAYEDGQAPKFTIDLSRASSLYQNGVSNVVTAHKKIMFIIKY